MKRPLIKISTDELAPEQRTRTGKYKDENGYALHGVYIRETKNCREKLYIDCGHLRGIYTYPKINSKFSSPYVNDHNLHLCGAWSFTGVQQSECLTRVVEGKKLMGAYIIQEKKEEYHQWREYCVNSGLPFKDILPEPGNHNFYEIIIARPEPLTELVDLDALQHDYRAYAEGCKRRETRALIKQIDKELLKILTTLDEMKTKRAADYLQMDYANPKTAVQLMRTGLLLGFPIESTVSVLQDEDWYPSRPSSPKR